MRTFSVLLLLLVLINQKTYSLDNDFVPSGSVAVYELTSKPVKQLSALSQPYESVFTSDSYQYYEIDGITFVFPNTLDVSFKILPIKLFGVRLDNTPLFVVTHLQYLPQIPTPVAHFVKERYTKASSDAINFSHLGAFITFTEEIDKVSPAADSDLISIYGTQNTLFRTSSENGALLIGTTFSGLNLIESKKTVTVFGRVKCVLSKNKMIPYLYVDRIFTTNPPSRKRGVYSAFTPESLRTALPLLAMQSANRRIEITAPLYRHASPPNEMALQGDPNKKFIWLDSEKMGIWKMDERGVLLDIVLRASNADYRDVLYGLEDGMAVSLCGRIVQSSNNRFIFELEEAHPALMEKKP